MAVCAPNFALRDLAPDRVPWNAEVDHGADVRSLVSKMIEVQHVRIGLSAIDAGMLYQVFEHKTTQSHRRMPSSCRRIADLAILVAHVPRALVSPLARQTEVLPRPSAH